MTGRADLIRNFSGATSTKVFKLCFLIITFWLPITPDTLGYPIGFMILFWLFSPKVITKENGLTILLFSSVYLFHLIAMFYTEDMARGTRDLGQKASLIIFPIIIGTVSKNSLPERKLVYLTFLAGLLIAVGLSFIKSFLEFRQSGLITDFFMSNFPYSHHPSYFALFLNFGIGVVLISSFGINKPSLGFWTKLAVISLLVVGVIYSASKMGFIQFLFLIPLVVFIWFMNKALSKLNVALILLTTALFTSLFFANPIAKNRIFYTAELIENKEVASAETETESTVARIITWQLTLDEIMKAPVGVGTGDIQDVLDARYEQEGYHLLAEKGLNPHNEFLQIGLAQGIPALLIFSFSLIYSFWKSSRNKDWIYGLFIISILMHFMVESMLEKQSGVIFFAYLNSFLYFTSSTDIHTPST